MARLVAYSYAGVDPKFMGIGPVPAVRSLLEKTGLKVQDIDVFEVDEAFAAQALAVCRELDLPADRTNPNGSGISLGHPIGATGAVLTVKALYELVYRRETSAGDDVYRRRPRDCGRLRTGVLVRIQSAVISGMPRSFGDRCIGPNRARD